MEDYKQFLAQKLLTEDQLVTYRLLSRALKIHVNTAKEMLYDFHRWQNGKRPGSLHATYLLYGTKKPAGHQDGDIEMTDSQTSDDTHLCFSDQVLTSTIALVTEDHLQATLALFEQVTAIHVYSLQPHPLKDLQLLADTAKQVMDNSTVDDALSSSAKAYGTIINPHVRRRGRRGAAIAAHKSEPKPTIKHEAKPPSSSVVKEESKAVSTSTKSSSASAPAKQSTPAASLKRQGSSGISQMFAKAAAKPKKPFPKSAPQEDTAMSDDGEDDTAPEEVKEKEGEEDSSARQSRQDRQAELRRMMEESDEEEEPVKASSPAEEPMEEEPLPPEPAPEPASKPEAAVVATTEGGRRRGRRRVTRKKQVMDDQGYLVTIQEQGWESFSEDEAPAPAPKPKPASGKSESAAKAKKGAAKGQGNIMSFFSKK